MRAYSKLASVLSTIGYSGVKLARAMAATTSANAELKASATELERFAYTVSHDLRAPLRHLDGFLTLLFRRSYASLDEQGKHYVDNTLQASQRMGRLIDELLQFSRLGRTEMRKSPVDVNQIIDAVRNELEPESRDRVIRWRIEELPSVMADQPMLRQVIENLLGNALKFTRNREIAEITIGARAGENDDLIFFIEDNGAGFDMRYYDKLFQVFQRLHGEDEFEGTGIGLANVRRIVERHGGAVWAEGAVHCGAKFYFSLPQESNDKGAKHEYVETHSAG
jgi:light-regulated signal transduction histidine kinase (bacteriophytochrome)